MKRNLAWIVVGVAVAWSLPSWRYPQDPPAEEKVRVFGTIPVVGGGREMPIDSVARNTLRVLSGTGLFSTGETFVDESGARRPAILWYLDVVSPDRQGETRGRKHRVFRIDNPQLMDALGLKPREFSRYALEEFEDRIPDAREWSMLPESKPDRPTHALTEASRRAMERVEAKQTIDAYEHQLLEFRKHYLLYWELANLVRPHMVPPIHGKDWQMLPEAAEGGLSDPHLQAWREMLVAHGSGDVAKFNAALDSYLELLQKERPDDVRKAAFEARFNEAGSFNTCKWFYFFGFVVTCLGFLGWSRLLSRTAWALMGFTFVLHTISLVARIYISGRPPVTNLYSSAIFIGWAAVLLGLVLELIFKMGAGNIIAAVAGFATLQIAHILAADGDTMEVLVAVLDTQFWLATHVVCITLGYATTYVSGLLGLIYVLRGRFTPTLTPELARNLTRMTYGTTCFAMFFSFIGTVLGGLWADDSWGRFWGWDVKENGALMIVLWNALVLHARWGGMVRDRGMALLAIFGNIVVSWSWFGVNQLGVGLHNYGPAKGVTLCLFLFALSQAVTIGFGMKPQSSWKSALPDKGAHQATASEGQSG